MSLETLLEPFRFSFMLRAFVGTGIVAVMAAVVGTFVVLKGLAFMGDAIAHTAFTGSAVALLLGVNLYAGAMAFAVLTAVGVVVLARVSRVKNDTALAILFTGLFAIGVLVLSAMPGFSRRSQQLALRFGHGHSILRAVHYCRNGCSDYLACVGILFQVCHGGVRSRRGIGAGFPVVFVQMVLLISVAACDCHLHSGCGCGAGCSASDYSRSCRLPHYAAYCSPDVHGGGHWPSIGSHGFVYILLSCSSTGCYSSGGCHQYLCRSLAGDEGTRLGTEEEEEEQ